LSEWRLHLKAASGWERAFSLAAQTAAYDPKLPMEFALKAGTGTRSSASQRREKCALGAQIPPLRKL